MNDSVYAGLEPSGLWAHFAAINRIPRPSRQEEQMVAHVRAWADRLGFPVLADAAGNLCVQVPATAGRDGAPVVVLQGHLDMVCERDANSPYDAERGDIHPVRERDWIYAEGTTLGADNGIALAAMLHMAERSDVPRGPLDLLFTVDEETGLTGAQSLDSRILRGRILLNLDNEDEGELCVGCAGSTDATVTLRGSRQPVPADWAELRVSVAGLVGGHSGVDIIKPRINAIRALGRVLNRLDPTHAIRLVHFQGGNKRNAIPREASAVVTLSLESESAFRAAIDQEVTALQAEYPQSDDRLAVTIERVPSSGSAWLAQDTRRLLDLLHALPCGVLAMSPAILGLVETSNSIGTAQTSDDGVRFGCLIRSSVSGAMPEVVSVLHSVARLAGAVVEEVSGYPGWNPNRNSAVLALATQSFRRFYGHEPRITAVHAGLECGILGERVPGLDMVSFGPDIKGPHAPGERVHVGSVERFWGLLCAVLDDLSK